MCPNCDNSSPYSDHDDCTDEAPQDDWKENVVSFRPGAVFDISQTADEPLPELETTARGGDDIYPKRIVEAGRGGLSLTVALVPLDTWPHGEDRRERDVCRPKQRH